ncbi:Endonuclease/Exonuclease/phosphatase family protein [uncultured archaeon]|nr:Endonuclease/Exonuclease/phosphatase family protein [uncultured archaeon]
MRLLSLNIWGGRLKEKLIPFLADSAKCTDMFCFQEVLDVDKAEKYEWSKMSKFNDAFAKEGTAEDERIFDSLKDTFPGFGPLLTQPYSNGGARLATFVTNRTKVIGGEAHSLPVEIRQTVNGDEQRCRPILQHTRMESGGRQYNIVNFHGIWVYLKWHSDTPERFEQSDAITKFIGKLKGRTILCGDFNLSPDTESLRMIEDAGMRNLVKEFGIKSTRSEMFPKGQDQFADYVLVSEDVEVDGFGTLDETVSDHLPLYLDFK